MTPKLSFGASSDIGLVREINEDSKLHRPPLFAVADGMGGHLAGDVASAMAIETLSRKVVDDTEALTSAVREANRAIYEKASANEELAGMGTTLTALMAQESSVQIVHVGDCRAYLLRAGRLTRLTRDHTVVERLVQQGKILPEDADRHPQRSYLERALGIEPEVEIDVQLIDVLPGDRILLCSDGLFGMIEDNLILAVLESQTDPQQASKRLCEEAVTAGGRDNVTAIVVDYPADPGGATGAEATAGRTEDSGPAIGRKRSGLGRKLGISGVAVAVLALAGFAAKISLENSWFVSTREHQVAVFQGVNGSIAGLKLFKLRTNGGLRTEDLPDLYQQRLKAGIPASSKTDAMSIVKNLRQLAQPSPQPSPSPSTSTPPAVAASVSPS